MIAEPGGRLRSRPRQGRSQTIVTRCRSCGTRLVDDLGCAFSVSVHYALSCETAKVFDSGTVIITGPLTTTFSANGKTVLLNVPGPATLLHR
jgi:hypothetical protein